MKVQYKPENSRGTTNAGWLKSHHSFSFGEYFDRNNMHHGALRVINDDIIDADKGFGTHPHKNAEIITYVLDGAIAHKDSMGNVQSVPAGEVQYMSAGSGVTHSEFNPSPLNSVHLLQIWILPDELDAPPRYDQKAYPFEERMNKATLIASKDGKDGSLSIRQNMLMYSLITDGTDTDVTLDIPEGYDAYIHVATGNTAVADHNLQQGDALIVSHTNTITFSGTHKTNTLVFIQPVN